MTVRSLIVVVATPTMASTTNQAMHSLGENVVNDLEIAMFFYVSIFFQ